MAKVLIVQNKILHYRKPLYNRLSEYHDVTVLHSGISSVLPLDRYKEIIVPVRCFGPFFLQKRVLGEVLSRRYEYVISMFDPKWIMNVVSMFCSGGRMKFIWWGIGFGKSALINRLRLFLADRSDGTILYSSDAKEDFCARVKHPERIYVAVNTFDVGERIRAYESEKNSFLFVGTLDRRKQLDIMLRAFAKADCKNVGFVIVGDGGERPQLENLVADLALEKRVSFIGKVVETEKLRTYYRDAIASVSFGQAGLSVLQSLGYGVPFVTKKNPISGGEDKNIINGWNGFFCEDSLEALVETMAFMCAHPETMREMGKNAYNYYTENATMEKMVNGFLDVIGNNTRSDSGF